MEDKKDMQPRDEEMPGTEQIDESEQMPKQVTESTPMSLEKPPKARKPFKALMAVGALLLVALAGLVYYFFFMPTKAPAATNSGAKPATKQEVLTAAGQVIADMKTKLEGTVKDTDTSGPAFQPSGYEFWVQPSTYYGVIATSSTDVLVKNLDMVDTYFTDKDYNVAQADPQADFPLNKEITYDSKEVVCGITSYDPPQGDASDPWMNVVCEDMSDILATAKEAEPFAVVYAASTNEPLADTSFSQVVIDESPVEGYRNATVAISQSGFGRVGGFAGLFYQVPDGEWQYFKGTQETVDCKEYNTDDLKKAFASQNCYDSESNTSSAIEP